MLIEAAKGGHVNVVNLLLDWSANAAGSQTSNSPTEPNQASSSQLYPLDFEQVNRTCCIVDCRSTKSVPFVKQLLYSKWLQLDMTVSSNLSLCRNSLHHCTLC